MKNLELLERCIAILKENGYIVLTLEGKPVSICNAYYIFFSKDDKIGYCEADNFGCGLNFSTVHKPCKEAGTGYSIFHNLIFESKILEYAAKTLNSQSNIKSIVKYKNLDEFIQNKYLSYKEI